VRDFQRRHPAAVWEAAAGAAAQLSDVSVNAFPAIAAGAGAVFEILSNY